MPPSTAQQLASWGVPIPPGVGPTEVLAVHPTQIYEVTAMLAVFWLLWRLRTHRHALGWRFAVYLGLAGLERFLVEFVRAKDDRFLGTFTLAQLASIGVILVGIALLVHWWRDDGYALSPLPQVLKQPRAG
jgi:phosphatidylglycerol:prolipoprotein diacylglycerol transferase